MEIESVDSEEDENLAPTAIVQNNLPERALEHFIILNNEEGPLMYVQPEEQFGFEQGFEVPIIRREVPVIRILREDIPPPASVISENESNNAQNQETTNDEKDCDSKRRSSSDEEREDDGRICPICLDNWTNSGEHRICALKCGHLFGLKCVNRWLASQQRKSCPTCKKRVIRSDIRYIYAKKLIAVDTTELDIMKKQIDNLNEEKNRVQIELTRSLCREHLLNDQVKDLKKQINNLNDIIEARKISTGKSQSQQNASYSSENKESVRLFKDKSLEICLHNGCRVLDANVRRDLIVSSMKSPNVLFTGYGIRKITISNYKPTMFIPLHVGIIRDVVFHPCKEYVLTASFDKSFKILDINSNSTSHSVVTESPLWSSCWDITDENVLYVGSQQGSVSKYDMRQLSVPVKTLTFPSDMSPVVSLASLESSPSVAMPRGGLVVCKLNSMWAFETNGADYSRYYLPMDGPFVCMRYQRSTKQMLVSSRPNARVPYARHSLCTLSRETPDDLNCNIIHSLHGGAMQKLLSRTAFVSYKGDFVAAHHEESKSVSIWNVNTGDKASSVPAHSAVLDICGIQTNEDSMLACLSERKLEFFKFCA